MKQITFIFIISILISVSPRAIAVEKVWVYSKGASLKADKKASSETITSLPADTELDVLSLEKRWYHVSTDSGEKGWIFRGKVTDTPPGEENEDEDEESLLDDLSDSGILLAAADTSRSIRGKKQKTKAYEQETETEEKYIRALDTVLSFYTTDDETESFLEQGRIGEYAE
ncbi:MAG: SH3 domain-containing protein [Desulfobacteraceae bacterium]|nr:SH3 domain-containing protein [Desulfobacteraceae bacterium]